MKETIIAKDGRRITRMDLSDLGSLTPREREMIRAAARRPIEYDADCPPLSPAMIAEAERQIGAKQSSRRG